MMNDTLGAIGQIYHIYDRLLTAMIRRNHPQLSAAQARLLMMLWQHKQLNIGELATLTCLKKTTLSTMLPRLQQLQLVEIIPDPDDGRAKLVRLTEQAQALRDPHQKIYSHLQQLLLADITDAENMQLAETLAKIKHNLLQAEKNLVTTTTHAASVKNDNNKDDL